MLGTGPAAVFTANYLGKHCLGFVDEDENKIGKTLMGLPIVSVDETLVQPVILPYPNKQQQAIKKRLSYLSLHCLSKEI